MTLYLELLNSFLLLFVGSVLGGGQIFLSFRLLGGGIEGYGRVSSRCQYMNCFCLTRIL